MSKEVWLGQNNLRFWYFRYKDSPYYSLLIISITVSVCLVLFTQVIQPQFENWISIRNEVVETQKRISVLQDNINFMNNLDRGRLNTQLQVSASALPPEKDFGAVLSAISDSAIKSGVTVPDYSFQVGEIASTSGQATAGPQKGLTQIKLSVVVSGNLNGMRQFLIEIGQKLPLSEITAVDINEDQATLNIEFYQKPFPQIVFRDTQPLPALSDSKTALIQRLSSWQSTATQISSSDDSGASSAALPVF